MAGALKSQNSLVYNLSMEPKATCTPKVIYKKRKSKKKNLVSIVYCIEIKHRNSYDSLNKLSKMYKNQEIFMIKKKSFSELKQKKVP